MTNLLANPALWTFSAPSGGTSWDGIKWQFASVYDYNDSLTYKGALPSAAFEMLVANTDPGDEHNPPGTVALSVVLDGVATNYTIQPNATALKIDVPAATTSLVINVFAGTHTDTVTLTPPAPAVVAPVISDLDIDLRYSKDGSHNWADWRQQKLGDQGAFNQRAVFRRLGFGRRIVLHVRVSADKGRDLIAASVDTEAF